MITTTTMATVPTATVPSVSSDVIPPDPGNSKNCEDFSNYAEAKEWFDTHFPYYGDVARLDGNEDGIPCQSLPGAP